MPVMRSFIIVRKYESLPPPLPLPRPGITLPRFAHLVPTREWGPYRTSGHAVHPTQIPHPPLTVSRFYLERTGGDFRERDTSSLRGKRFFGWNVGWYFLRSEVVHSSSIRTRYTCRGKQLRKRNRRIRQVGNLDQH